MPVHGILQECAKVCAKKTKVGYIKSLHQFFTFPLFNTSSLNSVLCRVNLVYSDSITGILVNFIVKNWEYTVVICWLHNFLNIQNTLSTDFGNFEYSKKKNRRKLYLIRQIRMRFKRILTYQHELSKFCNTSWL